MDGSIFLKSKKMITREVKKRFPGFFEVMAEVYLILHEPCDRLDFYAQAAANCTRV